jgi:hypothetical protein
LRVVAVEVICSVLRAILFLDKKASMKHTLYILAALIVASFTQSAFADYQVNPDGNGGYTVREYQPPITACPDGNPRWAAGPGQ